MTSTLIILAGIVLLYLGGEALVRGAGSLALRLGLTPLAVGLTVVAFGTSSPELVVSVLSARRGLGDLAVGNVVGSNICNIALILGLAACLRPVRVSAQVIRLDIPILIATSLAVPAMLANGLIGRGEGAVAVAAIVLYTVLNLRLARREAASADLAVSGVAVLRPDPRGATREAAWVALGLVGLILGGNLLVRAAVPLATAWGLSEAAIGLTVVAVGTSLPELATTLIASLRGQHDIAVGNVIGSNIFNSLAILGAAAIVEPLAAVDIDRVDLVLMLGLTLLLLPLARTGKRVSRGEGVFLVAVFVAYTVWRLAFP